MIRKQGTQQDQEKYDWKIRSSGEVLDMGHQALSASNVGLNWARLIILVAVEAVKGWRGTFSEDE